jgi:hypothetical protein
VKGRNEGATAPKRQVPIRRDERDAMSQLSATSRGAIVECFNHGNLQKYKGSWYGSLEGKPISGNTVASLGRDGLLAVIKDDRAGSANLTERGQRIARMLIELANRQRVIE